MNINLTVNIELIGIDCRAITQQSITKRRPASQKACKKSMVGFIIIPLGVVAV